MWGLAALAALLLVCSGALAEPSAAFRSVVVFGDTQELTGSRRASDAARLREMVDWVLEHREDQHIDFVLHVGDAIRRGGALPLGPECLDDAGRCDPSRRFQGRRRSLPCGCKLLAAVDEEWRRFNAQWRRFDGVIPYAIVQGNHDNLGASVADGQLDRPGFAAFYGPEHFRATPGSGWVAGHVDARGVSQAWKFRLGEQEVLVIGAAHEFSPKALRWAESVLDEHPGLPVIALAHQYFWGVPPREDQPRPVWKKLVVPHADRFRLAVWGHVSPGEVRFVALGGVRLLRLRSDWQGDDARRGFLHLVRFYPGEEPRPEVEVLAFDPVRGRTRFENGLERSPATRGLFWLPRQPFAFFRPRGAPE